MQTVDSNPQLQLKSILEEIFGNSTQPTVGFWDVLSKKVSPFRLLCNLTFSCKHRCDEYAFVGQNVFLGPLLHLPCPYYFFQSHHWYPTHIMSCFFWLRFQKSVFPMCSARSDFAITLVASRPQDAFIDQFANSILGVMKLSMMVKIASWNLFLTASTIFHIF